MAVVAAMMVFTACKNETSKESETVGTESTTEATHDHDAKTSGDLADATFGVRGNCNMCKATIEKAAGEVDGVENAVWDVSKKKIDVSFDASKTSIEAIKMAIAGAGYDTEGMRSNEEAYKKLPACCQYDHTMDMNQEEGTEPTHAH